MALAALCGKNPDDLKPDDLPESWISIGDAIEVKEESWDEFLRDVEFSEHSKLLSRIMRYQVTPSEFIRNMLNVSASQGIRMARRGCTVKAEDMPGHSGRVRDKFSGDEIVYLTPLFYPNTARLPKVLRLRGLPGVRCHDVSTINARNNMWKQHIHRTKNKSIDFELIQIGNDHHLSGNAIRFIKSTSDTGEPSYSKKPESIDTMVEYFSECLFIALICRMTGNANVMDCFVSWKETLDKRCHDSSGSNNTPVPTNESVMEWIHWLCIHHRGCDTTKVDVKTTQCSMNALLARSVRGLALDVLQIAPAFTEATGNVKSSNQGMIPAIFRTWAKSGDPKRSTLVNAIAKCISNAVGLQMEASSFFLAHQVVADFESFLPGIAGEVTADSVHFGHGGREGTDTIHFDNTELNRNKSSRTKRKARLEELHHISVDHYLNEASKDELETMGLMKIQHTDYNKELETHQAEWTHMLWKRLSGCQKKMKGVKTLVIMGSWKTFDLTDTEHLLCKLYLLCIQSGVSRNFSDAPWCGSPHTHPRKPHLTKDDWDNECKKIGLTKWNAFCKLKEPDRRYSHHLSDINAEHLSTEQVEKIIEAEMPKTKKSKQKTPSRGNDTMATDSVGDSIIDASARQQEEETSLGGKMFPMGTFDTDQTSDDDESDDEDSDDEEEDNLEKQCAEAEHMALQQAAEAIPEGEYDIEESLEGEDPYLEDTDRMMRLAFPDKQ